MLNPLATAFIFPGQGSQAVGMGAGLAASYSVAKQTFEEADDLLGLPLSQLCFNGPEEQLTETYNAQPALYVCGIAALRTLYEARGDLTRPAFVAGHSLGELTALTAAGALSFPDGLRLVRKRGELMRDAGHHSPGGMAALLGLNLDAAQRICEESQQATGGIVVVANDNCPGQLVIAGDDATLTAAIERATAAGAKRAVKLQVSIAAHSPLMARAAEDFREALQNTAFHEPLVPVIGNTKPQPLTTVDEIRSELNDQLVSPVRWSDGVRAMVSSGVATFVELGSKNILVGLLKRIDRQATGYAVDTPESLQSLP